MAGGQAPCEVSRPPSQQASRLSVGEPETRTTAVAVWRIRTPPGGRLVYHRLQTRALRRWSRMTHPG